MTSPPDVWALLERLIAVIDGPKLNDEKYSFKAVEAARAALAQRDQFVLVPKEPEGSDERERILKLIREELRQYYVSVPLHGCLFIERGHRK